MLPLIQNHFENKKEVNPEPTCYSSRMMTFKKFPYENIKNLLLNVQNIKNLLLNLQKFRG